VLNYQKTNRYFAQAADGIEILAGEELEMLGATDIKPAFRGIHFSTDKPGLYKINYCSRLTQRVLAPIIKFDCHSNKYLYKTAREIQWSELFSTDKTFAIYANVSGSRITHSQYAALKIKDAIADSFNEQYGRRPDVDTRSPDVRLMLHIQENRATIYWDTSGESLHKRGYRKKTVSAPMRETIAAAIIRLSEWNGNTKLSDPMCGSGTLLAEALMFYCRIPAGFLRKRFGFELMPDFEPAVWNSIKNASDKEIRALPKNLIAGSDISQKAIDAAGSNLKCLPSGANIKLEKAAYDHCPGLENQTIISNPPYGIRDKPRQGLSNHMKSFGDYLKHNCKGSRAFIYFGERELIKKIELRTSWKKPLNNGGLDGRLCKFEMY